MTRTAPPHSTIQSHGKRCTVCKLPVKLLSEVERRLKAGGTATAVHRWLTQKPEASTVTYTALARHVREHIKGVDRAVAKLSDAERLLRERQKLARQVLSGEAVDPAVYFAPQTIAVDVKKTTERLDHAATEAFMGGQHQNLAQLSSQLLKSAELRAKMGGSIKDAAEVSISVGIANVTDKLSPLLNADPDQRAVAARQLLGLCAPPLPAGIPVEGNTSDEPHAGLGHSSAIIEGEIAAESPTVNAFDDSVREDFPGPLPRSHERDLEQPVAVGVPDTPVRNDPSGPLPRSHPVRPQPPGSAPVGGRILPPSTGTLGTRWRE